MPHQATIDSQVAAAQFTGQLLNQAAHLRNVVSEALAAEDVEISNGNATVLEAMRSATTAVTVGALLALLIGLGAAYVISRGIANPIRQLRDGTRRVGRGELDVPIHATGPRELQELAASFGDMTRQLADSEERLRRRSACASLGSMAATVSHELRNPLGVVRASIYTVKERTLNKGLGVERALERMERSIDRCVGIIGDLLDFARVKDLMREATNVDAWLGEFLAEQGIASGHPAAVATGQRCPPHIRPRAAGTRRRQPDRQRGAGAERSALAAAGRSSRGNRRAHGHGRRPCGDRGIRYGAGHSG